MYRVLRVFTSPRLTFGVHIFGTEGHDGYLPLPIHCWGMSYTVGTVCRGTGSKCQLVVLAHEDFTSVTVFIPAEDASFKVTYDSESNESNSTEVRVLMAGEALVITKTFDITGSTVISNVSVGVLAGAEWTQYESGNGVVVEQIPPATALGNEYITLNIGSIRIIALEPHTTVHTTMTTSFVLKHPGNFYDAFFDQAIYVRTDRPILMIEYGSMKHTGGIDSWYPFVFVLTPILQFIGSGIQVYLPEFAYNYTMILVARNGIDAFVSVDTNLVDALAFHKENVSRKNYEISQVHGQSSKTLKVELANGINEFYALYVFVASPDYVVSMPLAANYEIINDEKVRQLYMKIAFN